MLLSFHGKGWCAGVSRSSGVERFNEILFTWQGHVWTCLSKTSRSQVTRPTCAHTRLEPSSSTSQHTQARTATHQPTQPRTYPHTNTLAHAHTHTQTDIKDRVASVSTTEQPLPQHQGSLNPELCHPRRKMQNFWSDASTFVWKNHG